MIRNWKRGAWRIFQEVGTEYASNALESGTFSHLWGFAGGNLLEGSTLLMDFISFILPNTTTCKWQILCNYIRRRKNRECVGSSESMIMSMQCQKMKKKYIW